MYCPWLPPPRERRARFTRLSAILIFFSSSESSTKSLFFNSWTVSQPNSELSAVRIFLMRFSISSFMSSRVFFILRPYSPLSRKDSNSSTCSSNPIAKSYCSLFSLLTRFLVLRSSFRLTLFDSFFELTVISLSILSNLSSILPIKFSCICRASTICMIGLDSFSWLAGLATGSILSSLSLLEHGIGSGSKVTLSCS